MDKAPDSWKHAGVRRPGLSMSDPPGKAAEVPYEGRLARRLTYMAMLMGLIAALVGAGDLAAWLGGYLSQRGLSTITMKTNAALCLTLVGVALMLLVPAGAGWVRRWSARICAGLALLVGFLTLAENLSGWNLGINQLLAGEAPGALAAVSPNQMGPPASVSFTLLGLALLLLSRRDRPGVHAVQVLALVVCLIALLPTIGFLYGAEEFYGIARYTGIAWPTAVTLLLLGFGLLCARPAEGLMAQVTAGDPGGFSIRRLLPAFVLLPLLLGWLRLAGERGGLFDAATGTGIMMLVFIILFGGLTYHAARRVSRAAAALQWSEEKFAKAFRSSPAAIAITRLRDGRVMEVNETLLKLLHFTRDEVIGCTTLELGIWVDLNERAEYIQRLAREGSVRGLEYRLRTREGAIVTIQLSAELVEIGGEPCMLATLVDMTERERAEEELRESEQRYRRLVENLKGSHFIYRHDTTGVLTYVSESVTQVLGYTPEDGMPHYGKYFTDHPVNQAAHRHTELTLQGIRQPPYEVNVWHKDGSSRWLEVQEVPVYDAGGKVVAVEGVAQDITERKHAEEALQESERRHRSLYHAVADGIFVMGADGQIRDVNDSACAQLGYAREELIGMPVSAVSARPDFHPGEIIDRLRAAGSLSYETTHRRKDGVTIPVELSVALIEYRGRPAVLGVARDITERKRAEEALRELNATLELQVARRTAELQHRARQLQKLTLELSQVEERERRRIAVILHEDVQQQIAGAKFHLGLLKNWAPQDAGREVIERVEEMLKEAIEKSRRLSHDLSPAVLYMNDLGEVLRWLADRMQAQYGLVVAVAISGKATLQSEALTMFLFRAAQELLFNVVKHARVNEAALRVRRRGRRVYLGVADRGRGFDPQEFNETAGFGLLSIRERVELLGGRMKIKSSKGRGSTLCLVVPDSEKPEDRRPKAEEGLPSSGRALRVLLADDHEIVREGLVSLLKETPDLEVVGEASNGHEAIDLACTLEPDVLIMDASMPIISGAEATRRIKERLPEIRIVALSMYEDAETIERMRQAGAESYVLKTAPSEELLAAIRGGEKAVGSRATSSDTSMSGRTDGKET